MKINGDKIILDKKAVSDWLCLEFEMVHTFRNNPESLKRQQNLIEGALGLLELRPPVFREIFDGSLNPTDENLYHTYQAVIREFGPSGFRFLANLGGEHHAE